MFLIKPSLAACAMAIIASLSTAQAASTIAQEKLQVLAVAKKYAEATACGTTFDKDTPLNERTNIKDVFLIDRSPDVGGATYYVYWGGDVGCGGGSGGGRDVLSEIHRNYDIVRFVVLRDIFDLMNFGIREDGHTDISSYINTRFIQSLKRIKDDEWEIIALSYVEDKNEPNAGPSSEFKYILKYDRSVYRWRLIKKVLLSVRN